MEPCPFGILFEPMLSMLQKFYRSSSLDLLIPHQIPWSWYLQVESARKRVLYLQAELGFGFFFTCYYSSVIDVFWIPKVQTFWYTFVAFYNYTELLRTSQKEGKKMKTELLILARQNHTQNMQQQLLSMQATWKISLRHPPQTICSIRVKNGLHENVLQLGLLVIG